jgi:hypothetical protein
VWNTEQNKLRGQVNAEMQKDKQIEDEVSVKYEGRRMLLRKKSNLRLKAVRMKQLMLRENVMSAGK